MRRAASLRAVLFVAAVLLTACSPADDPVLVDMTEFRFEPSRWTVEVGRTVEVEATNSGTVTHQWVVLAGGVTADREADLPAAGGVLDPASVLAVVEVAPGETESASLRVPSAGSYRVVCAIPGHLDAGMVGELVAVEL